MEESIKIEIDTLIILKSSHLGAIRNESKQKSFLFSAKRQEQKTVNSQLTLGIFLLFRSTQKDKNMTL
ncbi:hypothetical protein A2419_01160 [Candidatus Adlerbacteria bacterium RIFOXYC1_FULL_48_26]|uniref:Uncharacterized protein n=1 Tax=Candidatus Adlerbacteria bacterium RIFOXYC1_FULL_48_26 TaxID=1797247 RepID=A0A1F4Y4V4_9BACT|nr:MAG: hypothetical protein A2419_01160 [Candidatus Adlerbacteria bacterium RIFOXYC1_FULL_48_26]OGC94279.1 MAG: hypothetical protein A2389_01060 [Candidatus Adlerbacteria bacterium RIFOXYB1_FULL_48_10]OGC95641.1 MAG: hypothetical protein A2590_00730 [Candidatus Adlerbacteria bacterium RIFOXYD1_FULL_48_8]